MRAPSFRGVIVWTAAPLLLATAVAATSALVARGMSAAAASTAVSAVLFVAILWLERLVPHRPEWNARDGQLWNDIGHTFFGTGLGAAVGNAGTELAFAAVGLWAARAMGGARAWPAGWPLAAQIPFVFLLADLGRYVQHRAMHAVPALWRFHVLHHSVESLNVWKTSRSHVVERIFQQVFMFGPLVALGAPDTVLLYYIVPNTFLGLFAHSNADVRLGALEYLIMGPASHRMHHSRDLAQGNTNYGSAIVLWDIVFRTHTNPLKVPPPEVMGVQGDRTPPGFFAQIIDPFVRRS